MGYPAVTDFLQDGKIAEIRSPEDKAAAVIFSLRSRGIAICERLEPILTGILIAAFQSEVRVTELEEQEANILTLMREKIGEVADHLAQSSNG